MKNLDLRDFALGLTIAISIGMGIAGCTLLSIHTFVSILEANPAHAEHQLDKMMPVTFVPSQTPQNR